MYNVFILESHFLVSEEILNQSKAREFCQKFGPEWDLPDGETNIHNMIEFMKQMNSSSTWILLQRHTFKHWQWVNGSMCE